MSKDPCTMNRDELERYKASQELNILQTEARGIRQAIEALERNEQKRNARMEYLKDILRPTVDQGGA